ncbi:unnamed protein product [Leptidea sinapis]|uniref:C-type lectin domain-containing protein n=1 Tax=Leptidea sinapis TaxID=189913 RepID=A0A5E4PT17_9NEOP|nr:unnamed protein product [Leptidea sinapis]
MTLYKQNNLDLVGKGVDGHKNYTRMSYVCPPDFIRLGHSCYFFSDNKATWQTALFACKFHDAVETYLKLTYSQRRAETQNNAY